MDMAETKNDLPVTTHTILPKGAPVEKLNGCVVPQPY